MAGNLGWAKIALFPIGKGNAPEKVGFLCQNSGDFLPFGSFQDNYPKAVGNVTAGGQERGHQMLSVTELSYRGQLGANGDLGRRFSSFLANFMAANALGGGMIGIGVFAWAQLAWCPRFGCCISHLLIAAASSTVSESALRPARRPYAARHPSRCSSPTR